MIKTLRRTWHQANHSLAWRLLGRVVLLSTLVTIGLAMLQNYWEYSVKRNALERRLDEISETYASGSLAVSLWEMEHNLIQTQLDGILRLPDIRLVELREDVQDSASLHLIRGIPQTQNFITRDMELSCFCGDRKRTVGTLHVEATLNNIYRELFTHAVESIISIGISIFILSLSILLISHRIILRHLYDIASAVADFDPEKEIQRPLTLKRCPYSPADELCNVVNAFNTMSARLNTTFHELKLAKQALEKKQCELRALSASRDAAREEERKRIARELHDELGQLLTALRLDLSSLCLEFYKDNTRINERIQSMLGLIGKMIHEVRNVAESLRPTILNLGLGPAIEWLATELSRHSQIICTLHIDEHGQKIDEAVSIALFRITQESLTNIARHTKANHVIIRLSLINAELVLEISDNGEGFDTQTPTSRRSFGLVGMRERMLILGGQFDIFSTPGLGTRVRVTVPQQIIEHGTSADASTDALT